jgi:hypothetical protein
MSIFEVEFVGEKNVRCPNGDLSVSCGIRNLNGGSYSIFYFSGAHFIKHSLGFIILNVKIKFMFF